MLKLLITFSVLPFLIHSQEIHPNRSGDELKILLVRDYKPKEVLSYAKARDTMYKNIYRGTDGYVTCFYSGHSVYLPEGAKPRSHLYQDGDDNGITAEHIYPQSKGAGKGNAKSNMHSIVPVRGKVNSARSNYPFSEIPDNETDHWYRLQEDLKVSPSNEIDNYSERLNGGWGHMGKFEPRESVKGDIARAVFYFYTMYKSEADAADPQYFRDMLPTLIDWHHQDPASDREIAITYQKAIYQEDKANPYVIDSTLVDRAFTSHKD